MARLCDHCRQSFGYCRFVDDRAKIYDAVAEADKTNPGNAADQEGMGRRLMEDAIVRAKRRGCPYPTKSD